jgi:hypothetical protein
MSDPILTPLGEPDHDGSYQRYLDSLEACPGCGRVDEMDNITGQIWCAACSLHDGDDEDDEAGFPPEWT